MTVMKAHARRTEQLHLTHLAVSRALSCHFKARISEVSQALLGGTWTAVLENTRLRNRQQASGSATRRKATVLELTQSWRLAIKLGCSLLRLISVRATLIDLT